MRSLTKRSQPCQGDQERPSCRSDAWGEEQASSRLRREGRASSVSKDPAAEGVWERELQSEGVEDRRGQTQWKWMARWNREGVGVPRLCRTSQADLNSQQVTLILKILKSSQYFKKQWLNHTCKDNCDSVRRIDGRRVQSGFGIPSYEAVARMNPESSLNLNAGGEDYNKWLQK